MTEKTRYYFDHNATTIVRPEVVEAMLPWLGEYYGNPSSVHSFGREAKNGLDKAREKTAELINAEPDEIFFTGCGTESDNIALAGCITAADKSRNGLVTSTVEHSAIIKTADDLEEKGYPIARIGVDSACRIDMDALKNSIGGTTRLVSIMHANNETGVVQDIAQAAAIAHDAGAYFHTDAVQSAGKKVIDVKELGIDMLSMSGHKINAPKGVGVLYIKKGVTVNPLMFGGSHESGMRPGTENIPSIVAFATALEIASGEIDEKSRKLSALVKRLEEGMETAVENIQFNGREAERIPGTSNISIPGVDGEALLFSLDMAGIAASTGSACSTGEVEPSHVLVAMGISPKVAQSSLRFSMGYGSTEEGVDRILEVLPPTVKRLRAVSGGL